MTCIMVQGVDAVKQQVTGSSLQIVAQIMTYIMIQGVDAEKNNSRVPAWFSDAGFFCVDFLDLPFADAGRLHAGRFNTLPSPNRSPRPSKSPSSSSSSSSTCWWSASTSSSSSSSSSNCFLVFFCSAWSPFWVSLAVSDPSDFSPYLQGMTLLKTLVSVVGGGPWKNLQPLNLKWIPGSSMWLCGSGLWIFWNAIMIEHVPTGPTWAKALLTSGPGLAAEDCAAKDGVARDAVARDVVLDAPVRAVEVGRDDIKEWRSKASNGNVGGNGLELVIIGNHTKGSSWVILDLIW